MSTKIKPIHDLYFRFIKGTAAQGKLEPQELAVMLERLNLVHLVPHRTMPRIEHYIDADAMKLDSSRDKILEIIKRYEVPRGL